MKYTEKMKADGEIAVRRLSEEAAKHYNGTDPLTVFAYENEDGETRYSYSYSTNPYADRYKTENLTFEELQEAFEEAKKELDKQLEAEPEKQPEPTNISTPQAAGKIEVDHMKYNGGTKLAGEAACRRLSKKAAEYYNAHQLSVFEYNNENGEKRYAYSSDSDVNAKAEDLTFEELQAALEDMQSQAEVILDQTKEFSEAEKAPQPDEFLTGDYVRTPRGSFHLTALSREQMQAAGYGLHHESEDGKYYIMGNGTDAFAVAKQPEKQPEGKELIALLTVNQCGFTKYFNMGDVSMDDIFRQLKNTASPFVDTKGEVISDEGRFAELEQSGKVSVSVTADIDNDSITVYEINGVPENDRTKDNTRIWNREKMTNFLKDRVREPKTDNSLHSPYHGVGRSHVSEHEREM